MTRKEKRKKRTEKKRKERNRTEVTGDVRHETETTRLISQVYGLVSSRGIIARNKGWR